MAANTFDIVSQIDLQEVSNAVHQAQKELTVRYDLKNSKSSIDFQTDAGMIVLRSQDEFALRSVSDVLDQKLVRRKIPMKGLIRGKVNEAAGASVTQEIRLQQGIPIEKAREIVKAVKNLNLKVQSSIQGDQVRVSGKKRDDLQQVMAELKQRDFGIDMQFVNYRSN